MSKLDRIARVGLWPRCLGAELAALYVGVSRSDFYRKVQDGTYPQPFQNGGLVQWDRNDLDEAVDALKQKRKSPPSNVPAGELGRAPADVPDDPLGRELDAWNPGGSAS